jgi:hypothetical protein
MFYPWNLDDKSGALDGLLRYSKALKRAGFRLDCYAPKGAPDSMSGGLCHGVFENVFVSPDRESPLIRNLEVAGAQWEDPILGEKLGRDEASMASAAILASISDYDVVGVHYSRCHSLRKMLPAGLPAVMFTHDLDSLVCLQQETIFGTPAKYQLADEVSRLKSFDLVTVVGPDDRRMLQSVEPGLPVVEAPFTSAVDERATTREHSTGVLLWISAAAPFHRFSFFWFWNKVWPKIRVAKPECRLVIAGRISEVAKQLGVAVDPQVSVLGVVDDADGLYRAADILIAPYYFGLGIKTKVIEALAKGIPVATTTLGISNTHIQPGRDAVVSDEASDYANEVIRLISSPALRSELARNGREYVRKWHDPHTALEPFVKAFEKVALSRKTSPKWRAGALRHLQDPLQRLVTETIQRCESDGIRTVAIYGAGGHTELLIPIWQMGGGPAIQEIFVTGEPSETIFMDLPLVSANHFDPAHVDAIVLSSQGFEQEMAGICTERWPEVKVYSIWQPLAFTADFEAVCHEKIPTSLYEFI